MEALGIEELASGTTAAIAGLLGGVVLGICARWGRFCTLGAIEDAVLGNNSNRLRAWGLAIAVAMFGSFLLQDFGLITIADSFYVSAPPVALASIIGGLMFGYGMALVGTCGYGTLARLGGGDLKALTTLLVMGVTAYATMRGLTSSARLTVFATPSHLEEPASFAWLVERLSGIKLSIVAYTSAVLLAVVCLNSRQFRADKKRVIVGIVVGLVIVWGWYATAVLAHDDFDPYSLESFTFSAPIGESDHVFHDRPQCVFKIRDWCNCRRHCWCIFHQSGVGAFPMGSCRRSS